MTGGAPQVLSATLTLVDLTGAFSSNQLAIVIHCQIACALQWMTEHSGGVFLPWHCQLTHLCQGWRTLVRPALLDDEGLLWHRDMVSAQCCFGARCFTVQLRIGGPVSEVQPPVAGSERQKEADTSGSRLEEAKKINGSLSSLGRVIKALTEQTGPAGSRPHVPYRDSKLTHLLKVRDRQLIKMPTVFFSFRSRLLVACPPARQRPAARAKPLQICAHVLSATAYLSTDVGAVLRPAPLQ